LLWRSIPPGRSYQIKEIVALVAICRCFIFVALLWNVLLFTLVLTFCLTSARLLPGDGREVFGNNKAIFFFWPCILYNCEFVISVFVICHKFRMENIRKTSVRKKSSRYFREFVIPVFIRGLLLQCYLNLFVRWKRVRLKYIISKVNLMLKITIPRKTSIQLTLMLLLDKYHGFDLFSTLVINNL